MMDLDNPHEFARIVSFEVQHAFAYGNGDADRNRREIIREAADTAIEPENPHMDLNTFSWFAFRIKVYKYGSGRFDIDNVPKPHIDAFCERQIEDDESNYVHLALYEDDTIDHVKYLEIYGDRIKEKSDERTEVDVFGKL
jgi:hypothetical protein